MVWSYGFDHTSSLGFEIPIYLASIFSFLLVSEYLSELNIWEAIVENTLFLTLYSMVLGLFLIVTWVGLTDALISSREDRLLAYDTNVTKGKYLGIVPRFLPSTSYAPEPSVNVYYSYVVDGIEYIQLDKNFVMESYDKAAMSNISVLYSIHNPLVSRIVMD